MTTIDDYVADAADQRRFGVMKIDVEGAEIEVLKGAQHSIASFRPALIIEIQPNKSSGAGWLSRSARVPRIWHR